MITPNTPRHFFKLIDDHRQNILSREINWSDNPIGQVTLYRTYLRKKANNELETWNECVLRVIEGMFSFQKTQILNSLLVWNEEKAQRTAFDAANRLFEFKWTPPGRGLWMMGTDFVWERGGACLNNPLHPDTQVLTQDQGWVKLGDLEGKQDVMLYSCKKLYGREGDEVSKHQNPLWVSASISHTEIQPTKKITYKNRFGQEYTVIASENHRWFRRTSEESEWTRVTTLDLSVGDHFPEVLGQVYLRSHPGLRTPVDLDSGRNFMEVVSIEDAGMNPVLCATVPEYEQFVIDGGCLTSNCAFVSTDTIDTEFSEPFRFLMDMSMLGVGVGFDTAGAGKLTIKEPKGDVLTFRVPDTREGWVDAIGHVIDSFFKGTNPIELDVSLVRPYGAPIKGFGGVASGPRPLVQGANGIHDILSKKIGQKITSVDITDIQNIIGKIVIAGNVRRTAEIAIGEVNDQDFRKMKSWEIDPVAVGAAPPPELAEISQEDYDFYAEHIYDPEGKQIVEKYKNRTWAYKFGGWRWASNNSLFASVGMDYTSTSDSIAENGEPGLVWMSNCQDYGRMIDPPDYKDKRAKGCNPCGEQTLFSKELCCLVETFPSHHASAKDYYETLKIAYLYAKTVTLIATHNPQTNIVMSANRRIGCSQSGIIEAITKFGRYYYQKNLLDAAYRKIIDFDEKYSEWLGVPKSIKHTSVKPSGSVSLLANVSPGIHYPKVRYGYRTMRMSKDSPIVAILAKANYRIEPSVTDPLQTVVAYFPIIGREDVPVEADATIWEQFTNAVMLQKYWADNQVSITISFKPEEKGDIAKCLSVFDSELKAVSLLPLNDHGYKQAPYINTSKSEVMEYKKTLLPLDLSQLHAISEGDNAASNRFCDGDSCTI